MKKTETGIDLDYLCQWTGRTEERLSRVEATPIAMFNAILDYDNPFPLEGDVIPSMCYRLPFPPLARQSLLKRDGHPRLGDFMPPVPLPRHMNAGGRLQFLKPLHVGEKVHRICTIGDITHKQGRSGQLIFVDVSSETYGENGLAVIDEQPTIYREADTGQKPVSASDDKPALPGEAVWRRTITPDPVLLFRFSAMMFAAHRIHYDHPYSTQVEGYPNLVFHGPFAAVLLMDLLHRECPDKTVTAFNYRAGAPLFVDNPFDVCGEPSHDGESAKVWTENLEGFATMTGTIDLDA